MSGVVRYAHGKRNHVMTPAENGPFVRACDYDTLRAQLEAAEADTSFATAAASLREWKARAEAAEAECARLRSAGAMLANCAFNLAQRSPLSDYEKQILDTARREWDAARTKEQQA